MATGPKIVHKQFNSPMGLYSRQNIQETLNKHIGNLDNGSVGIDFNNPNTDKPANLANSAVLRMLEEEERNRRGYPMLDPTQIEAILATLVRANHRYDSIWPPKNSRMKLARSWDGQINSTGSYVYPELLKTTPGQKKVVWPPVPETNGYHSSQSPANAQHSPQNYQQSQPQHQQQNDYQLQNQHQSQQNQFQTQQTQYPSQQTQQNQVPRYHANYLSQQQQPAFCEGKKQETTGLSKLIPFGPGVTASQQSQPASYRQSPLSPPAQRQPGRWAPAPAAPVSPQPYSSQQTYDQYPQQSLSPQPTYQSQYSPQYQDSYQGQPREPPASIITLRPQPPIHQQPPPVYASQPATASFQGGVNMRGDQKWPPQSVREAVEAENEARRQLAKGPACRPRKVKKDYTGFFAQHALNNNYPGYRAPPGTQHYEELSGRSSY